MANDIVLSAASRANLLSLQSTQKSIDITQLRLATGKKVNSALDNPQSFFQSQSLSNRASDLTRLLDGIGQSIQTLNETDKGITALTKLVEQAQSIVGSARDELAGADSTARLVGSVDLRSYTDIASQIGNGIGNNDYVRIITVGDNGAQIANNISITTGDTAYTLAAKITNAFKDNNNGEIKASITDQGFLSIESTGGRSFKIGDGLAANALTTAGYTALGLKGFEDEQRGTSTLSQNLVVAGNTVKTISLYEGAGNLADAGDLLVGGTYQNAAGTNVIASLTTTDSFNFTINNAGATATGAVNLTATTTFQDVVDQINGSAAVNKLIKASFDTLTGSISITSLSDTVKDIQVQLATGAGATARTFNLGWGDTTSAGLLDAPPTIAATSQQETVISFNSSTQALDGYTKDYNNIRTQIDSLVKDASYRGVNLLAGDNLVTYFNETNTSTLTTVGTNFTSAGLGLTLANFTSSSSIEQAATQTAAASSAVRSFGSSLANNLAIIQARQTFTQETINTLKAGAADLVNADLNEEGANLLALQTAQQLGVTSLSLASQSQQSVLRLF